MDFNEEFYMPELYNSDKESTVVKEPEEDLEKPTGNLTGESSTFEK